MAKIYRVRTGYNKDFYGHNTTEKAEYFFNKEEALARYKEGEVKTYETQITTIYPDGYKSIGKTGAQFFEREKANARPNQIVELVEIVCNYYDFEEVEVH